MANFFDKAFNKIDNKQEPVRVVEDTTETKVTNYKDFNDIVVNNLPKKNTGKNKSIYLTKEAREILEKYCAINNIKASHVVDTLIKQFLKGD